MTSTRARLSPPEAYFLLDPKCATGVGAFRVALLYLLMTGRVRTSVREIKVFFRKKKVPCLTVEHRESPALEPHLSAALDVVQQAQAKGGLLSDVAAAGRRVFGDRFGAYLSGSVVPSLAQRVLIEEHRKFLVRRYELTSSGVPVHERVAADVARAKKLPELLKTDPVRAARLAIALGGTLLLLEGFNRHYDALRSAIREKEDDEGGGGDDDRDRTSADSKTSVSDVAGGLDKASPMEASGAHDHAVANELDSADLGSFDFESLDFGGFDIADLDLASIDSGGSDGSGGDSSGGDGGGG